MVPGFDGKRIEFPDQYPDRRLWHDEEFSKYAIAEELGHSWDFKDQNFNDALEGGPLSKGLMNKVGANLKGCLTPILCWAYNANPKQLEKPVSKYAGSTPVEDWGGSFAQYMQPWSEQSLGPTRREYVLQQLVALIVKVQ